MKDKTWLHEARVAYESAKNEPNNKGLQKKAKQIYSQYEPPKEVVSTTIYDHIKPLSIRQ